MDPEIYHGFMIIILQGKGKLQRLWLLLAEYLLFQVYVLYKSKGHCSVESGNLEDL